MTTSYRVLFTFSVRSKTIKLRIYSSKDNFHTNVVSYDSNGDGAKDSEWDLVHFIFQLAAPSP